MVAAVGKGNVERLILAGHSQGGMTSNRIICSEYFKDKVDVRISLSGGRIGPVTSRTTRLSRRVATTGLEPAL